jgi:hypothetical protein
LVGLGLDLGHDGTAKGLAMVGWRGRQQIVHADGVDEFAPLTLGRSDSECNPRQEADRSG